MTTDLDPRKHGLRISRCRAGLMRKPLTDDESLAWWRAAMAGKKPTVYDEPQAGWYRRRLVKDGPWCSVRIWLYQPIDEETGELCGDAYYCCDVDGRPSDPERHWLFCCTQPIAETEYIYMMKLSKYAKAREPREPLANPRKPIDLLTIPAPTFKAKRRRRP